MNRVLTALLQLTGEAHPALPPLISYEQWLEGAFQTPCQFIHVEQAGEVADTLASNRQVFKMVVVYHFARDSSGGFERIEPEPLLAVLRRERFQYPATVEGERLVLNFRQETLHMELGDRGDRLYITCDVDVPVTIPREPTEKIEYFEFN